MQKVTMNAPDWFVKIWDEAEKAKSEMANIMNVGPHWLDQAKNEAIIAKKNELNRNSKRRLEMILQYGIAAKEFAILLMPRRWHTILKQG